jgi:hypothetical protein
VISLDDVGVDKVRDKFCFADEIIDELFLVGVVLADDFYGNAFDELARAVLFGFIHDAHPAFKNFAYDVVAKFVLNGEERHLAIVLKPELKSSFALARMQNRPIFLG